jgi:hypothetical protein
MTEAKDDATSEEGGEKAGHSYVGELAQSGKSQTMVPPKASDNPVPDGTPNAQGVYPERERRWAPANLRDPRDPSWEDYVAAERRQLIDPGGPKPSDVISPLRNGLALAVYRYTKGPDFTNDELGYGEQLVEKLWYVEGGKIIAKLRTSQRTKTGRQKLKDDSDDVSPQPPKSRTPGQAAE